jgi:hypothetical protein
MLRENERGAPGVFCAFTELCEEMWAELEGGQSFAAPEEWKASATFSWFDSPNTFPTGLMSEERMADPLSVIRRTDQHRIYSHSQYQQVHSLYTSPYLS